MPSAAGSNERLFNEANAAANITTSSTIGGLAVGVPGELRGWEAMHNKHGSLPW